MMSDRAPLAEHPPLWDATVSALDWHSYIYIYICVYLYMYIDIYIYTSLSLCIYEVRRPRRPSE